MKNSITYVAMDTHKKEHQVAVHFPEQEEILQCSVKNTTRDITKMIKKVLKQSPGDVKFCYEAGVCGFDLKRRIEAQERCSCAVIAPSLVPCKPGERVKTDRRDALKLLSLFKAGLLTEVHAPNPQQEAARELTRCRQAAQEDLKRARHQLQKFLTRHGYVITEIFEFGRFACPGELMSYLGLTCSEFSSGDSQKRGPITKSGNKRVRRILVEASWHYRHPCPVSQVLKARRKGQPQWAIDIADQAGQRLGKRYRYLNHRGKMPCKVVVAVARELAGFIWAMMREYEVRKNSMKAA